MSAAAASKSAASRLVVVMGAGPGLGFAVAKRFAQAGHPVALVSRSQGRLDSLASEINALSSQGYGEARAFAADASSKASVDDLFAKIQSDFAKPKSAALWGAVFNSSGFGFAPLLDTTEEMIDTIVDTSIKGGIYFAQAYLRTLTAQPGWDKTEQHEAAGFLAITGATASIKGGAKFSAFAAAKFGLRAVAQSTAREWSSQGVHVFHTLVDGLIDSEVTNGRFGGEFPPDTRFRPDDMAETYYATAMQKKSTWTQELDLRPFSEKF